jgi:hypothetical protein
MGNKWREHSEYCHLINLCLNTFSVNSFNHNVKWEASVVGTREKGKARESEPNHLKLHYLDLLVRFYLFIFQFVSSVLTLSFFPQEI